MGGNLGSVGVHQRGFYRGFDKRYGGFGKNYLFKNKRLINWYGYAAYVNIVYTLSR